MFGISYITILEFLQNTPNTSKDVLMDIEFKCRTCNLKQKQIISNGNIDLSYVLDLMESHNLLALFCKWYQSECEWFYKYRRGLLT